MASGGKVERYMTLSVRYAVTSDSWKESEFAAALRDNPRLKFVKPAFVHACWRERKVVHWADYAVKRK